MAETVHEILSGKVQLFRRPGGKVWHCRASVGGKQQRQTTRESGLAQAKDVAEDWYLGLRGKAQRGELKAGLSFKTAADRFIAEYEVVTQGERSDQYVKGHKDRLRVHLVPFFGKKAITEITPGMVQDYRHHRIKTHGLRGRFGRPGPAPDSDDAKRVPARSTLHQEIVCLRQVLKYAHRHGQLPYLPNLSPPYRASGKVSHRAWFSPAEYKRLYEATRERSKSPLKERWRPECELLHDFVIFMVNTGLRPDEALRLEYRDVEIASEEASSERILHIEVRGKRGTGYCKSMPGAVKAFKRLRDRAKPEPSDLLFPKYPRDLFNTILDELNLKTDRDGQSRTAYSLRHSYISMRLMEGADIYQVAKNCRTSVEMIQTYYASHIKNTLDAAAINVRRPKPVRRPATGGTA